MIVNLPDIQTQKIIGSILGALSDKIRINDSINDTLEEIGLTLYRYWIFHLRLW